MEKIKIQGKDYITVNERIKEFRKLHPQGQILNQVRYVWYWYRYKPSISR